MNRFAVTCAALAALGVAMIGFSSMTAANNLADDELTIKDVMKKVNGKAGLKSVIEADIKAAKWDDLSTKSKELIVFAKALAKNDPPKGDKVSWKEHTDAYMKAANDLVAATEKKDAVAATAAVKGFSDCRGCHTAHRGK